MDELEAKSFLGTPPTATATGTNNPIGSAASFGLEQLPNTERALLDTVSAKREDFRKANQEPGTPLDMEAEASAWDRMMLSFRREKENQVSYLKNKYGEDNVRTATDGSILFRVMDSDTGKPKDIPIDSDKISGKDFIDLIGSAPEIAGGIYALRKGRAAPFLKTGVESVLKDAATTAVGAEVTGAAKDIGVGLIDKGSADVGGILQERGKMAALDVGIGLASFPIGKFFSFMENPLAGSRGKVQFDAIAAQKYFKDKYGVDVPLSIGESTGNPFVSRTETFMEKMPGAATPFRNLKAEQEGSLRKLQSLMMGKLPESDEEIGNRLIAELKSKITPLEDAVGSARQGVQKTAASEIEGIVSKLTTPERQLYRTETGKEIRAGVIAKRDAAKAESNRLYGEVNSLPGGTGKVFGGTGLQQDLKGILEKLPAPESITEVATGILDARGNPILRTEKGKELLKEFVPPNILARLKAVAGLKEPQFSLSDLQQMRREVYDDIAKGEGVPGIGTHYLADIGKSITKAIDDGVKKLPTGDLKAALQAANEHYKTKVIPFNRTGLTEMFRASDEAGNIVDSSIISRLFGGDKATANYALLKETLGDTSPEFIKAKRAIADNILEASRLPGNETLDATALMKNLSNFQRENREMADDIFGKKINSIFKMAKVLDISGTEEGIVKSSKISSADLSALLKDKNPTVPKLRSLIKAEAARDEAYKTQILKDVSENGTTQNLKPDEFVNRFVDSSTTAQTKAVMDSLKGNPALVEDLRAKMVEKLFRDAARSATPQDISQLMSGDATRIMSGTSLFKQIEDPTIRTKLEAILGKETYKDVSQYIKLEAAGEAKETSFKAAGGLAAGMQIASLTRSGPLKYLYGASKDFVVASLLTRQPLRAWLTKVPSSEPGAVSLLLTSPPFIEAVTKEFGQGTAAESFIQSVKQSVDKWVGETSKSQDVAAEQKRSETTKQNFESFLKSEKSSMTPVAP